MKEKDIRFNIGDIVYAVKGVNRHTNDYAILKQKVEAVMVEVNSDGWINEVSYVLTDDLGHHRSTKVSGVFATFEEALEYAKND
jgi:hypothetical protein